MTFLGDALADLIRREPGASVALLSKTEEQADQVYKALRRTQLDNLSRVREQMFSFGPGIEVADVSSTKGLEFDYVIMLGIDQENYPQSDMARRLLHTGMTRAIHQLWLVTWSSPSRLLPADLPTQVAG